MATSPRHVRPKQTLIGTWQGRVGYSLCAKAASTEIGTGTNGGRGVICASGILSLTSMNGAELLHG